jgi:WD40 repeat protein
MGATPPGDTPSARRRRVLPILALAATLAAFAFAGLWLRNSAAVPTPYRFTLDQTGPILFSPNGRWMVTVSTGLRVRSLQDVKWHLLPGTDSAVNPFWSPDSSTIGFFADGRLRAIGNDGSNLQNLAAAPEPRGGSWRGGVPDGTILFASAGQLQTLDLRSGKVSQLALRFSEGKVPSLPVFCPEGDGFIYLVLSGRASGIFRSSLSSREITGQHVLDSIYGATFARHPRSGRWQIFFVRGNLGILSRAVMTAPIDPRTGALTGDAVRVVDAVSNWAGTDYATFDVSSNGMIYWRNTTPALPIWRLRWFDRNGNVTGTTGDAAGYFSISLSPDDSRVATVQGFPDQQVWIHNLQNGTATRLSSQPSGDGIAWSPDGGSIYFTSLTDTGSRVMRQSADPGSTPEVVYVDTTNRVLMVQAITPGGRGLILAEFVDPSASTIMRLDLFAPLETRKPEPLFPTSSVSGQFNVRISPDGRLLVVIASGIVYASRFPPAGDILRQVATYPASAWAFFSRDGRTLYVISGQALYSHPVITAHDGGLRLGERSLLFRLIHPMRTYASPAAASRDGNRLLALATDSQEETRLQVLTDWTSLLTKP